MHVVCWPVYSRSSAEASLDPVVSQGEIEEPSQPSDKVNIPSTSQEPSSSSAGTECISARLLGVQPYQFQIKNLIEN